MYATKDRMMKEHTVEHHKKDIPSEKEETALKPGLKEYVPPELRKHGSYKDVTKFPITPPTPTPALS